VMSPPMVRCTACGASFDENTWQALDLAVRIASEEVSRFLLGWSSEECIEVRSCSACEKRIAARVILSPALR